MHAIMSATQDPTSSNWSAVDITTAPSSRNVRFTLRKKRTYNDRNKRAASSVNLSSYNSDFLSGLFADVAKANVLKELSIELPSSSTLSSNTETCPSSMFDSSTSSHLVPDSTNSPRPQKKCRVSYRASSYRSHASCMNLLAVQNQPGSSDRQATSKHEKNANQAKKQDSLAYQLDCLEQDSPKERAPATGGLATTSTVSVSPTQKCKSKKIMRDVAALAFPNLPSTVSDSSCERNNVTSTGLTRERCLVQHGPAPGIAASPSSGSKDSFGWFVDLDDNNNEAETDVHHHPSTVSEESTSSGDLAFQAPSAPLRANNNIQEEMEQAYAADTIDSVLGDLF